MTFLLLYLRIFPRAKIRKVIWWTLIVNCTYTFVFVVVGIFQCQPIGYYWKRWDGEHHGRCIDLNALGWLNAAISIVLDIWMLAIPLTQIIDLNMQWKKRVGVGLMFSVGILQVFLTTRSITSNYFSAVQLSASFGFALSLCFPTPRTQHVSTYFLYSFTPIAKLTKS